MERCEEQSDDAGPPNGGTERIAGRGTPDRPQSGRERPTMVYGFQKLYQFKKQKTRFSISVVDFYDQYPMASRRASSSTKLCSVGSQLYFSRKDWIAVISSPGVFSSASL